MLLLRGTCKAASRSERDGRFPSFWRKERENERGTRDEVEIFWSFSEAHNVEFSLPFAPSFSFPMLLLRSSSSRLAALARNRPAGAFSSSKAASRQPLAVVSVASPSRTEECAQERNGSGAVASVLSSASNKAAATKKKSDKKNKLVASALGSRGAGEASPPDRTTSEALVAALQQPAGDDIASSSDEAAENKSRSEIQALAARLWSAYDAALTDHPIAVKSATSFVGFLLGDLIAQSIVGLPYDARRTLRLVAFGVFMDGPIGKGKEKRLLGFFGDGSTFACFFERIALLQLPF